MEVPCKPSLSPRRHLLAAHGASLAIESAPGKGTKVRLVFPAAKA